MTRTRAFLLAASGLLGGTHLARADSAFVPFADFAREFEGAAVRPATADRGGATDEVGDHLRHLYRGVTVRHSFMLDGDTFDCVPVAEQPSVRAGGGTVAPLPPAIKLTDRDATHAAAALRSVLDLASTHDAAGNSRGCAEGTIPMRRVTRAGITGIGGLRNYLAKAPGRPAPPRADRSGGNIPASFSGHSYAYAYTYGTFYGSFSELALWRPPVSDAKGQTFSLSQQWVVAGSNRQTQTVEVGWHVYPVRYNGDGGDKLFVYWTADGYGVTGCYNLDCPGFVQVTPLALLGATFSSSTVGGVQKWVDLGFTLIQGRWWLQGNGTWIGYYPVSIFNGGQLTHSAQLLEWGGETYGTTSWPPMSQGYWGSAPYGWAGYHRRMAARDVNGALQNVRILAEQPFPNCYTATSPTVTTSVIWGTYFFFGGPGGTSC